MAKKAGRPSKADSDGKETRTRPVRVYEADAERLYWIGEVLRKGSAEILVPILREEVTALYESLRPQIDTLKKLREEEDALIRYAVDHGKWQALIAFNNQRLKLRPAPSLEEALFDTANGGPKYGLQIGGKPDRLLSFYNAQKATIGNMEGHLSRLAREEKDAHASRLKEKRSQKGQGKNEVID